mmetsp:Transcript_8671/g.18628  ORF Transcript_8671/g.18628 Transcript_8671/m.18628 type:complete len:112 (-) Transcript_8671:16-351(-)
MVSAIDRSSLPQASEDRSASSAPLAWLEAASRAAAILTIGRSVSTDPTAERDAPVDRGKFEAYEGAGTAADDDTSSINERSEATVASRRGSGRVTIELRVSSRIRRVGRRE